MAEVAELPTHGSGGVLAATKLHIPGVRPELVVRSSLIERLVRTTGRKLTLVDAPAGYGKTTLLAEWCSSPSERREFAWLWLDEGDSDPVRFWTGVVDAIRTLEPELAQATAAALETRSVDVRDVALPLLLNELARLGREIVLVLDEYQTVRREEVHRSVDFLLERLPVGFQVAVATRADPPLSLARLRARGEMLEIRAADLRFSDSEAADLLRRTVGLELSDQDVARLHERSEGWPAGLYLAGLSLRGRENPGAFIESFAGDDRHIVDYLSSEVLTDQPDELRSFLLRTSVLERLSGPLCDAVAETAESGRLLERIESRNLFLIPLDTTRTWYRYHRLFAELLRHELELSDPDEGRELHRRACDWYREEGSVPDAIHHATAAGDTNQARELIALHWNDYFNRGRLATVERWLGALPDASVDEDPRLCVASAWMALDRGRLDDANEWIGSAERATGLRSEEDGSIAADVAVLRAVHGFKVAELDRAREAALRVLKVAEPGSFPRTVAQLILGVVLYWGGELAEAAAVLEDAAVNARAAENDLGRSYALGYLGLVEVDRGRHEEAARLGGEAVTLSDSPGFAEHFVLMVGHLARGRAAEGTGRLDDAEPEIRRAVELARRGAGRLEVAAALLALARLRHLQGDSEEARASLSDARAIVDRCVDPGTLAAALESAARGLRVTRPSAARAPSSLAGAELTERELAVLRLLATDLSRREIADALYVSQNTVKTHAKGIYRKLDASTRDEAVARGRELGLV